MKTIKELRKEMNITQAQFSERYFNIPAGTLQNWEQERTKPQDYILKMLNAYIDLEVKNKNLEKKVEKLKSKINVDILKENDELRAEVERLEQLVEKWKEKYDQAKENI